MKRFSLSVVVFISGGVVMAYEITGSRIMAPMFGSSTIVWTALIGIILGALSLGYWLGGRIADKWPKPRGLLLVLLGAAGLIVLTALIKQPLLEQFADVEQFRLGVTIASVALFAPAAVVLGMVSPYATRLALHDIRHSGSVVGNLYAISTFGSIAGTFLAGFWLLPLLGNTALLYALASAEVFAALLLLGGVRSRAAAAAAVVILMVVSAAAQADMSLTDGDGIDLDTEYSRVRIFRDTDWYTGRPVLRMNVNDGYSSAMFTDTDDPTDLVYPYIRLYRLADHFVPDISRALMIGGAAYSYPMDFLAQHPDAEMDVVEIDARLTGLAEEHFRLQKDHPRLSIFHEDGRTFLNRAAPPRLVSDESERVGREPYDAIFMDAFHSNAVPYQLASREALTRMYDLLHEDGVVIMNTISPIDGEDGTFFRALYWTLRDVFPRVEIFPVRKPYDPKRAGNVMLVAFRSSAEPDFSSEHEVFAEYLSRHYGREVARDVPVLTDEKNPADYYSSAYLDRLSR